MPPEPGCLAPQTRAVTVCAILPRVAFEYGQKPCAAWAISSAFAWFIPGSETAMSATSPNPLSTRSLPIPAVTVTVDVAALGAQRVASAQTLHDDDPDAANTLEHPDRVAPRPNGTARLADGVLTVELPPISWTAVELARL